ncbi:MAG: stage III sporulation protein AE [Bacillota bacterium]|nr:stage III sporulation protein AE [Bacillota bacterium]
MEDERIYERIIEEQLGSLNFSQLEEIIGASGYSKEYGFNHPGIEDIISKLFSGETLIDFGEVLDAVIQIFMNEIFSSLVLFGEIIFICAVSGLMKSSSTSFGETTVSGIGQIICNYAAAAVCAANFYMMYRLAGEAIDQMTGFIQALSPVMVTLLVGSGGVTTGAVMNPVVLMAAAAFASIIDMFIFPAVFMSCAFFMINSLTGNNYIRKLAGYIRRIALFTIGICVLVFSGLSAVQGIVTVSADSVLTKAAKYSVGNFVPIIGGFAADSLDLIRSCCTVIKGAAGLFGIIALLVIISVPILKLAAAAAVYKLAAAVTEPLGNDSISDCMSEMGNTVITLAVIVFLTGLMFLIFIAMFAGYAGGGFG